MKASSVLLGIVLVVICTGCEPPRKMPQPRAKPQVLGPPDTTRADDTIKSAEEWKTRLKSADPQVRLKAAEASLGPESQTPEVLAALIELLQDQDTQIRTAAARALGRMGTKAREAVPDFAEALHDPEPIVRAAAAQALGKMGPEAKEAVPALIKALGDKSSYAQRQVFNTGPRGDIVAFGNRDVYVRVVAAEALGKMGPEAADAIPALQALLKDEQASVREMGAEVLGQMGEQAAAAIPALRELLRDEQVPVRTKAAEVLGRMGPNAKEALPTLAETLYDKDPNVRAHAAWALGQIGPAAKSTIPDLSRLLDDEAKCSATGVLQDDDLDSLDFSQQHGGHFMVPVMHSGPQRPVRTVAAEALSRIGLQELLTDRQAEVRLSAARTLVRMGPTAAAATADLIVALHDESWEVRGSAAEALGNIGSEAHSAVADLQGLLDDEQAPVREAAAVACGKIGPKAAPAVPDLTRLLEDEKGSVRKAAVVALGRIGPAARTAVPALTESLRDSDRDVRAAAAATLGELGPDARTAILVLKELLTDESAQVRRTAAEALGRIGALEQEKAAQEDDAAPATAVEEARRDPISTRNLAAIPGIEELRRLCQSLALLDAIICPEWEGRFHSFNCKWGENMMLASWRNGSGDDYHLLFCEQGAIMKGFDHESRMSPYQHDGKVWDGVLSEVPAEFGFFLKEPAFDMKATTFCVWRLKKDSAWHTGKITFPDEDDPDGSQRMMALFDRDPKSYKKFADDIYGDSLPPNGCDLKTVIAIYAHEPLTGESVAALNPKRKLAGLKEDVAGIGYPASKRSPKKASESPD